MASPTSKTVVAEREHTHGAYRENAACAQKLKTAMREAPNWARLSAMERESLESIATKISRILCGDPSHVDSWTDIAGYAQLIERSFDAPNGEYTESAREYVDRHCRNESKQWPKDYALPG